LARAKSTELPLQIPLSLIGSADAFAARVAAFRQQKLDHHGTIGGGSGTALPTVPPAMGINCMMRIQ
jgi:hypothetical protein